MFFNGFGVCPVFASDREHQVMQSDHRRNFAVGSVAVLFFHPLCGVEKDFHIAVSGLFTQFACPLSEDASAGALESQAAAPTT